MANKEIEHSSNLHKMKPLRAASLGGFFSFYVVEHLQVSYRSSLLSNHLMM